MNKKKKLLSRLYSNPTDFTYHEARTLLTLLGFTKYNKGKTSGSRIMFLKNNIPIYLHKPHSRKELLHYQIKELQEKIMELKKDE